MRSVPGLPGLARRALAEFTGSGLLVAIVVGSGIMAAQLSPDDVGLQLLENSLATAAGLAVLIVLLGPVSGAHFNPVVSLADWALGRSPVTPRTGLTGTQLAVYLLAQVSGAISGAVLANVMFGLPAVTVSGHERSGAHLWLGELVATAGLVALIVGLARTGRTALAPAAIGAFIGATLGALLAVALYPVPTGPVANPPGATTRAAR